MPRVCAWLPWTLAVLTVAGCASQKPRYRNARAVDWESDELQSRAAFPTNDPGHSTIIAPTKTTPSPAGAAAETNKAPRAITSRETWIPLLRWCAAEHLPTAARLPGEGPPRYSLQTTNGTFVLTTGSRVVSCDGLEVRFGFAPLMIDSQLCIHALDLQKTLQPLVRGGLPALSSSKAVIVIDAGHGGEDPGTRSISGNSYEKDFTLDWALRLAPLLRSNGWAVFLTRTNDSDLALSNRVNFADAHKANLFLSLHFNSAGSDESQKGLETYCLTPAGMFSTVTRGFSDDPTLSFPNNAFDAENLNLAARVHRALLATGMHDRGVRRARFPAVLRGQQRPAILIEGGYVSNREEAGLIARGSHRQKLAEAIAAALQLPADWVPLASQEAGGGK